MKIGKTKNAPICCVCGEVIKADTALKFDGDWYCNNPICESEAEYQVLWQTDILKYIKIMDLDDYYGYEEPTLPPCCCCCGEAIEDGEEYFDFVNDYICGRCEKEAKHAIFEDNKDLYTSKIY